MKLHFKNKKMDVLDMRGHAFIASRDTLASKLLEQDSAANASSTKDSLQPKKHVKDSIISVHHNSAASPKDSLQPKNLVKDTAARVHHDSLAKDSPPSHNDSLAMHQSIHGSDTMQFNQIKGKNMKGYFKDNKMYKVNVFGNAQTIYYSYTDNNTSLLGANRTASSNMIIFIVDNKVNSITFLQKPDATLFPVKQLKPITDFLLGGFHWLEKERPRTIADIFKGSE
jgi:hypothetical protein